MRSSSTRLRIGGALAATTLSVLVGLGGPAFAETGQGEARRSDQASGARNGRTANDAGPITEDTDTNDGPTPNNVVDAGDNAHPSGNDRSVENGGSGNQGNATSEPDGNNRGPERDNGGIDQPGNPGGTDLADQDANNGCGNDDDFEDDNEGLCGRRVKSSPTTPTESSPTTPTGLSSSTASVVTDAVVTRDAVLGARVQNTLTVPTASNNPTVPTQILGVSVERTGVATALTSPTLAAAPAERAVVASADFARPTPTNAATEVRGAALARTGFGTSTLVMAALSLLLVGFAMVRRSKGVHFTV